MAKKKPKKEVGPNDAEDGGVAAAPTPKGRRKLVLIAVGAMLLVGAGGGYLLLKKPQSASEAQADEKKKVAFVDIREMTVNLASEPSQAQRFLKFRVALEVKDAKSAAEIQPLLPRVEDSFQVFVRELRASDLDGSAGVYRLREELVRRVNIAVYPAKVDAVLFKDIVIQ
jgi:flagellar protein FliL